MSLGDLDLLGVEGDGALGRLPVVRPLELVAIDDAVIALLGQVLLEALGDAVLVRVEVQPPHGLGVVAAIGLERIGLVLVVHALGVTGVVGGVPTFLVKVLPVLVTGVLVRLGDVGVVSVSRLPLPLVGLTVHVVLGVV